MSNDSWLPAEVGLDDLFGRTGTHPVVRTRSRSPGARWLLARLFFGGAGAAVTYAMLYFLRLAVPFALLLVFILAVIVMRDLLTGVAAEPLPAQLTGRGMRPPVADRGDSTAVGVGERDGVAVAVDSWAGRLALTGNGASGQLAVISALGDLVDERLRLRHGFTRSSDPLRAREMMGEHLWRMLHNPSAAGHTPRDMAVLVQRIEEL